MPHPEGREPKTPQPHKTAEEILEARGYDIDALYSEMDIFFSRKTIMVHHAGIVDQKTKTSRIKIADVVEYYRTQARNIVSGCRQIADIVGDWRPIDELAKTCLEIYKVLRNDELKRECRKNGMEPKWR